MQEPLAASRGIMMGSPASEPQRGFDEGPQQQVTIARPFAAGKFEITFAEWDACVSDRGCVRVDGAPGAPDDDEGAAGSLR